MSYTEIYKFKKDGNAEFAGEVRNAWRGAMAIWNILEDKYLPMYRPSYVPAWVKDEDLESYLKYKPKRTLSTFDNGMQEVWGLWESPRLSYNEKVVLMSTFDYVVIQHENLPDLIEAFRSFEGETSLKEQADILEAVINDNDCLGVGFNQTSVNGDTWANFGGYTDNDEPIPYNILTGEKHWYLFKEVEK